VVWALIFYVVVRYRRRSDELPSQKQYNVPWEVAYTAIPVVIVAVLFGFTVGAQNRVDHLSANPAVSVQVTGYQWGWRFEYAGTGVSIVSQGDQAPILVVPSGQSVRVVLVSADVVHGFYVPDFLFKRDAVPGFTNRFDLNVQHPGTYGGRCTVFCGLRHDRMLFTVQAMAPPDFAAWLARQRSAS
jgi:cytochrome c oxidase subunit 2